MEWNKDKNKMQQEREEIFEKMDEILEDAFQRRGDLKNEEMLSNIYDQVSNLWNVKATYYISDPQCVLIMEPLNTYLIRQFINRQKMNEPSISLEFILGIIILLLVFLR
jgi:hypothetical protein